jgi:hypothetical protein
MLLNDNLFGERRRFARKECFRMIGINNYKKLHTGYIRDLGLAGAFIEPQWGAERTNIGQKILLAIPYGLKEGYVSISARIEWIKGNGIGVQFQNDHARRKHL